MYPNYVYRPQRAKDKDGRSKSRKPKGRRGDLDEVDSDSVSFVVPVVQHHRHHGRSASAPTPPPYQSIQIPNVYQMTPSCPTSPSLLPMISRRSSHPDHTEDPMSNFDFHPDESFMQPSSFGQFEASLQVRLQLVFVARKSDILNLVVRVPHLARGYASSSTSDHLALLLCRIRVLRPLLAQLWSLHTQLRRPLPILLPPHHLQ